MGHVSNVEIIYRQWAMLRWRLQDIQDVAKVSSGSAWFPLVDQSSLRPATKTGAHATCLNDADHADALPWLPEFLNSDFQIAVWPNISWGYI